MSIVNVHHVWKVSIVHAHKKAKSHNTPNHKNLKSKKHSLNILRQRLGRWENNHRSLICKENKRCKWMKEKWDQMMECTFVRLCDLFSVPKILFVPFGFRLALQGTNKNGFVLFAKLIVQFGNWTKQIILIKCTCKICFCRCSSY